MELDHGNGSWKWIMEMDHGNGSWKWIMYDPSRDLLPNPS